MRVRVRKTADRVFYTINCPGCGEWHSINDGWAFNGDLERPTFSPSILVKSGHYVDEGLHDHPCWCDHNAGRVAAGEEPSGHSCSICHSFVDNGRIKYLGDSTHALAGQTAELLEIEAFEEDVVE